MGEPDVTTGSLEDRRRRAGQRDVKRPKDATLWALEMVKGPALFRLQTSRTINLCCFKALSLWYTQLPVSMGSTNHG